MSSEGDTIQPTRQIHAGDRRGPFAHPPWSGFLTMDPTSRIQEASCQESVRWGQTLTRRRRKSSTLTPFRPVASHRETCSLCLPAPESSTCSR